MSGLNVLKHDFDVIQEIVYSGLPNGNLELVLLTTFEKRISQWKSKRRLLKSSQTMTTAEFVHHRRQVVFEITVALGKVRTIQR